MAKLLSRTNQDVVLIDEDEERLASVSGDYDLMTLHASPTSVKALQEAGVEDADLFIGVTLDDGFKTAPANIVTQVTEPTRVVLLVTIHEGKKREVRRMCDAVGLEVARLRRVSIGPVKLGMLKPGEWRDLTAEELRALRNAIGKG